MKFEIFISLLCFLCTGNAYTHIFSGRTPKSSSLVPSKYKFLSNNHHYETIKLMMKSNNQESSLNTGEFEDVKFDEIENLSDDLGLFRLEAVISKDDMGKMLEGNYCKYT